MNAHRLMAAFWVGLAVLFVFTFFAPGWAVAVVFVSGALAMAVYEWRRS